MADVRKNDGRDLTNDTKTHARPLEVGETEGRHLAVDIRAEEEEELNHRRSGAGRNREGAPTLNYR